MIDVQRSPEAPPSLARCKSWRDEDVLSALHRDFHGKCYLCESPVEPADFQVDHRTPRARSEQLWYEWTNLFPACERCNGRRPAYPDGGLLDPGEGIERRLEQLADPVPESISLRCQFYAVEQALRERVSRRAPYTMMVRSLVGSALDDLFD